MSVLEGTPTQQEVRQKEVSAPRPDVFEPGLVLVPEDILDILGEWGIDIKESEEKIIFNLEQQASGHRLGNREISFVGKRAEFSKNNDGSLQLDIASPDGTSNTYYIIGGTVSENLRPDLDK